MIIVQSDHNYGSKLDLQASMQSVPITTKVVSIPKIDGK